MDLGFETIAKIELFWNMAMLHIKLKLTTHAAIWLQIFCPQTNPLLGKWGQKVKLFFLKEIMVHIKFKGTAHRAQ